MQRAKDIENRRERYNQEFRRNKGLMTLLYGGMYREISSVIQCLLAVPDFVEEGLLMDPETPFQKKLSQLLISLF